MRNAIIGTIAGLLVGSLGALGYTQFFGNGSQLADLQAQLAEANAKLAKAESDRKQYKAQAIDEGAQVDQLNSTKDQLSKQLTDKGITPAVAPESSGLQVDPDMIRGFMAMMGGGRGGPGGFRSPEQRMLVLQTRLKLTSEQSDRLKAAMQADQQARQARRDAYREAHDNGTQVDQASLPPVDNFDKTLASGLTQGQQQEYQSLQNDEKTARAESSATQQVDSMMPLLQMTDDQKEKVMNALYQQQLSVPDPQSMGNNANPQGFIQQMQQQGKAMQKAMQGVLTPDQYALYQQSDQLQQQQIASRMNRGNNNGNGGNGNGGGNTAAASGTATPAQIVTSSGTLSLSWMTGTPQTNAASSTSPTAADSSSTNAVSATTNAASATTLPPPGN